MNQLLGIGLALTTMCLSAIGTCLFKPLTNNFEKVSEICDQAFYRYIFPLFTSLMCKHGSVAGSSVLIAGTGGMQTCQSARGVNKYE